MLWSSYQRLGVISRETGEACKGFDSAVARPRYLGWLSEEYGSRRPLSTAFLRNEVTLSRIGGYVAGIAVLGNIWIRWTSPRNSSGAKQVRYVSHLDTTEDTFPGVH
jgi:hypothetical protein